MFEDGSGKMLLWFVSLMYITESVDSISRDGPMLHIRNTLQNQKYLENGTLSRLLTFTVFYE